MGKKVLLGVTGSIAAYKSVLLCRELIKSGHEVKVIMTPASREFVSPLTFSTLSGHPVHDDISDGKSWNNHVELALWADVMVVAPCTATTLAKMAIGLADNMVLATYLSAKCPVLIAPAMDLDMWAHPATQKNIVTVKSFGHSIIPVGHGFLASGLEGEGRMAEPADIVSFIEHFFHRSHSLDSKKILITAGPTYEHLDPVRFMGNHSSGKMGWALALEAEKRGADVTVILGPTTLSTSHNRIKVIKVVSAEDMLQNTHDLFTECDVAIFSAAVSDYRPEKMYAQKIKKSGDTIQISLVKNKDIASEMGQIKKKHQITVGFALETDNEISHAQEKLHKKKLDFIVLNSLNDAGAGFRSDTNKIKIIEKEGQMFDYDLKSKNDVANDILDRLENYLIQKDA